MNIDPSGIAIADLEGRCAVGMYGAAAEAITPQRQLLDANARFAKPGLARGPILSVPGQDIPSEELTCFGQAFNLIYSPPTVLFVGTKWETANQIIDLAAPSVENSSRYFQAHPN